MSRDALRFVFLLVLVLWVYLAGNGRTQLFDRDEPRYAQCSRQMLQSGDWVVPRLYDKLRAAKPPGIYWCQACAMELFGDNAFAARFPSAVATVLVALLLGVGVWLEVGPRHALWSVFVLTSTLLMLWSGKNCLTDAVLLLCTTVGLGCIYLLWRGRGGWVAVIGLAAAVGCGGIVKGPFILGVLAGTAIALLVLAWLERWANRRAGNAEGPALVSASAHSEGTPGALGILLRVLVGVVIVAAIVLPWVYLVRHRAPEFLTAAKADAVQHLESGSEGHKGPPGYHLALIWATYLPWSLLLPLTIVVAVRNWRAPQTRFAIAAVLGTWVFVEILQTKLPHYILSAFPALSFLTADALVRCFNGERNDLTWAPNARGLGIVATGFSLVVIGPWWLATKFHDYSWPALVSLTVFAIFYAAVVGYLFFSRQPLPAVLVMGLGSMGLAVMLFVVYLPQSQPLRLPIRVADVLKANGATHPHDAVMFEYKEPSLAFYQGGTIREYDESLQQLALTAGGPRWAVIPTWVWDGATPRTREAFEIVAPPITGWDYSDGGKTAHVMVVKRR